MWVRSNLPGFPLRPAPVESAFFISDQFRLQRISWKRRAIDADKGVGPAGACVMDCLGEQLFSCPRFPGDQNRQITSGSLSGIGLEPTNSVANPDDGVEWVAGCVAGRQFVLKVLEFGFQIGEFFDQIDGC